MRLCNEVLATFRKYMTGSPHSRRLSMSESVMIMIVTVTVDLKDYWHMSGMTND